MSKHLGFLGMPQIFEVLEFDVLQEKVSLHVPLHRNLYILLINSGRSVAFLYSNRQLMGTDEHDICTG